ncbi:unnamed protein product (mitochondrion) [Plasmodiophora brassicae]|uniref:Uncharacterized protein n=2 Tax=Plasmodiophora brassicae TaxID=37360 RepID=A0A3P3Y9D3_PLABS|nr:unnamed protein product [Plasmodiophora brassicae]
MMVATTATTVGNEQDGRRAVADRPRRAPPSTTPRSSIVPRSALPSTTPRLIDPPPCGRYPNRFYRARRGPGTELRDVVVVVMVAHDVTLERLGQVLPDVPADDVDAAAAAITRGDVDGRIVDGALTERFVANVSDGGHARLIVALMRHLERVLERSPEDSDRLTMLISQAWSSACLAKESTRGIAERLARIVAMAPDRVRLAVRFRGLHLLQAMLVEDIAQVGTVLGGLPKDMRLSLLANLCVATDPRPTFRQRLWDCVRSQFRDIVAPSVPEQEACEVVAFFVKEARGADRENVVSPVLIQTGTWRCLCGLSSDALTAPAYSAVIACVSRSPSLAAYYGRAVRVPARVSTPEQVAILVAVSLMSPSPDPLWHSAAKSAWVSLLSTAHVSPGPSITVLEHVSSIAGFTSSVYGDDLRALKDALGTSVIDVEDGPKAKAVARLRPAIRKALKPANVKSD